MGIKGDKVGKYICGADILVEDCNVAISQPTIRDILMWGEDQFFHVISLLRSMQSMLDSIQQQDPSTQILSEFQLLLVLYHQDIHIKILLDDFFQLVFPRYRVIVTENSIDFKNLETEKIMGRITPFNFENLQNIIKELFLPQTSQEEEYNPGSNRAAEIAEKLKAGRDKINQQKHAGEEDASLFGTYLSILSVGLSMDMHILMNYTPFQLYDNFMRYTAKMASDEYFSLATVPFADTSKLEAPESWVSNLYK